MRKVKYYKKMKQNKNIFFSESWGEPLWVVLPNGKVLHCICEFYRGRGWYITDVKTGLLVQTKNIKNKTELNKYIKDENFLKVLERTTNTEFYKKQVAELNEYKKQFI